MNYDKIDMALDEAIEIVKEIEPEYESTNSGIAEKIILQAVHDSEIVRVVRCKDCKFCMYDDEYNILWCNRWYGCRETTTDSFCSHGERMKE